VRIDVLNGVNLDLLGRRDTTLYGAATLQDLETQIYAWARELDLQVRCRQTNHEGEYVEWVHAALDGADGLVLNPAAWTHYSWAIRDAVEPFAGPVVEVHISNVEEREEWRRHSVLDGLTAGRVVGKGIDGYREALALLASKDGGPS
jgi:3-dehydroquinate dehydratase II